MTSPARPGDDAAAPTVEVNESALDRVMNSEEFDAIVERWARPKSASARMRRILDRLTLEQHPQDVHRLIRAVRAFQAVHGSDDELFQQMEGWLRAQQAEADEYHQQVQTLQGRLVETTPAAPTEDEFRAVGADALGKSVRFDGLVHRLEVMPNDNNTGWIVYVNENGANLPQAQAEALARLLLSGPVEDDTTSDAAQ